MNELVNAHNALKTEHEALVAFKANADKKEKEALINSFYMLSDELKKEVVDKIDEYSLEDIEAKLSIICVRNKVSFDLEENSKKDSTPVTFNLNSVNTDEDESIPAWVKAVKSVAKELHEN